ncbi:dUTP pyrophosphatase, partial [Conidiobolus coronatus NRRL 28638]
MKLSTLLEVSPKVKAEIIRKINPRSQEESLLVTNNSKLLVSKISDKATLPVRANNTDAGLDLAITDEVTLNPGQTKLLNTGLAIALPKGTAGKIVTRSSLALNKSIDIKAGLIDEGYTGEIKILVHNTGANKVKLNAKEYIAQLLIIKCERPEIELVRPENLPETRRANKGFGSS